MHINIYISMKKTIKNKLARFKNNKVVHWIKNSTFVKSIKKELYFSRIVFSRSFLGALAGISIVLVSLTIEIIIEKLTGIMLFSSVGFVAFAILFTIISIIQLMYIAGFICPILEHRIEQYDKYNIDDKKIDAIKQYKSYCFHTNLKATILGAIIVVIGQVFSITFHVLYYPIISSVLIIPTLMMYQFVYKPARAGRLPKWLYRWLERKNPHMALPSALTAAAAPVDNAEYTVVDDAPERADA